MRRLWLLLILLLFALPVSAEELLTFSSYREGVAEPFIPPLDNEEWIICGTLSVRFPQSPVLTGHLLNLDADDGKSFLVVPAEIRNNDTKVFSHPESDSFGLQELYLGEIYERFPADVLFSGKAAAGFGRKAFFKAIRPGETLETVLVFDVSNAADGWIIDPAPHARGTELVTSAGRLIKDPARQIRIDRDRPLQTLADFREEQLAVVPDSLQIGTWNSYRDLTFRIPEKPILTKQLLNLTADEGKKILVLPLDICNNGKVTITRPEADSFTLQSVFMGNIYQGLPADVILSGKAAAGTGRPAFFNSIRPGETIQTAVAFEVSDAAEGWVFNFAPRSRAEQAEQPVSLFINSVTRKIRLSRSTRLLTAAQYERQHRADFSDVLPVSRWIDCGDFSFRMRMQPSLTQRSGHIRAASGHLYMVLAVDIRNNSKKPVSRLAPESFLLQDTCFDDVFNTYVPDVIHSTKVLSGYHREAFFKPVLPGETLETMLVYEVNPDVQSWLFTFAPHLRGEEAGESFTFTLPQIQEIQE